MPSSDQPNPSPGTEGRKAVVCSCDDNYIPHLATMLQTLADTNDPSIIDLYLVHPGLQPTIQSKLQRHLKALGIRFYPLLINHDLFAGFPLSGHISYATYYRLAIPDLLPQQLSKALYIDVDTCVTGDLAQIWDLDLQAFALAAVPCPNQPEADKQRLGMPANAKYLNAGVVFMNLDKLRTANLLQRSALYLQDNYERVMWWDQDLLNVLLMDDWLELPPIWNLMAKHQVEVGDDYRAEFRDAAGIRCRDQVRIVHFSGGGWSKPWHYNCTSPYRHTYLEARAKTPWRNFRPTGQPGLATRVRSKLRRAVGWLLTDKQK